MFSLPTLAYALVILSSQTNAQLTPTTPGPGDIYTEGLNCTIDWTPDSGATSEWKNVTIDLMSGSNNNMSLVTNVVQGLDGTDPTLTPYNWTCPDVSPNSDIYFYQFTPSQTPADAAWTTRFTIAASNGSEPTPPEQSTQPDGDAIPWGTGHLQNDMANPPSNASTSSPPDSNVSSTSSSSQSMSGPSSSSSALFSNSSATSSTSIADAPVTLSMPRMMISPTTAARSGSSSSTSSSPTSSSTSISQMLSTNGSPRLCAHKYVELTFVMLILTAGGFIYIA